MKVYIFLLCIRFITMDFLHFISYCIGQPRSYDICILFFAYVTVIILFLFYIVIFCLLHQILYCVL